MEISPKARIVVDSRVRVRAADVAEQLQDDLRSAFTHENPKAGQPGEPAFIRTWRSEDGWLSFPRGGYRRVRTVLSSANRFADVTDARCMGDAALLDLDVPVEAEGKRVVPEHRIPNGGQLWELQAKAVEAAVSRENCLVRAPTGSGKTTTALAFASRVCVPTIVLVNTGGLMEQWVKRCRAELRMADDEIGIIGDGVERTGVVTVAMQQTVIRRLREGDPRWLRAFGCVIVDEVHGSAADTVFEAVDSFPARYRVGVSADESRHDGLECLVYDLFGSVAADIKRADVVAAGNVLEVEVRVVPTGERADWYRATMARNPPRWQANRAFHKLTRQLVDSPTRNEILHGLVMREVADGRQVLVMAKLREHVLAVDQRLVGSGVRSGVMLGGVADKGTFVRTAAGIADGTIRAACGTVQAIGQGIDLPSLEVGVLAEPIASNRQKFEQARGRIARQAKGKRAPVLYYLWDEHIAGKRALANLCSWYGDRVVVRDGDGWMDGREYLGRMRGTIRGGGDQ